MFLGRLLKQLKRRVVGSLYLLCICFYRLSPRTKLFDTVYTITHIELIVLDLRNRLVNWF